MSFTKKKYKLNHFVYHIYPNELEIKDTKNTARSASYLEIKDTKIQLGLLHILTYINFRN